jgi:prephenate dehydrogenase
MMFNRVAIIGTGLMGGSLAMAIKALGAGEVVACDISEDARSGAEEMKVADVVVDSPAKAVHDADMIFVATPISAIPEALKEAAPSMEASAIVSDLASAKLGVIQAIESVLPDGVRYVGGHPMTGSEQSGVRFARPDLFKGMYYILTPTETTDPAAFQSLHSLLTAIGARVISMDPESHDRVMATISHVPHLLSLLLMEMAASEREQMKNVFTLAAGGFRDMTRISASSPDIWMDIVSENRAYIIERLRDYSGRVGGLIDVLERDDMQALEKMFNNARAARAELSRKSGAEISDLYAISLPVPDEPGVISRITTAVGALGTNIEDIGIVHPLEGETGILTLKVLGETGAIDAAAELKSMGYPVSLEKA